MKRKCTHMQVQWSNEKDNLSCERVKVSLPMLMLMLLPLLLWTCLRILFQVRISFTGSKHQWKAEWVLLVSPIMPGARCTLIFIIIVMENFFLFHYELSLSLSLQFTFISSLLFSPVLVSSCSFFSSPLFLLPGRLNKLPDDSLHMKEAYDV